MSKWIIAGIIGTLLFGCLCDVYSAPCEGRGSVVFYGNGMLNTRDDASGAERELILFLKSGGLPSNKPLLSDVAYKRSEPILEQLANVATQKGIVEFENFWAWLSGLQRAPTWFTSALDALSRDMLKTDVGYFEDLPLHFEKYAEYIRKGYRVILVSHSQGNLYANQAMRKMDSYIDGSLTGSLREKSQRNLQFPSTFDLFANIQVATPVSATVNSSPWTTFKDDQVISFVRNVLGALPPNVEESGVAPPPEGDFLGHSFTKAYLQKRESRQKILKDIQDAYSGLHYPIAYFVPAVLIAYPERTDSKNLNQISFTIRTPSGNEYGGGHGEERPEKNVIIQKDFVSCFDLKLGESKITAETIVDDTKTHHFEFAAWPDGGDAVEKKTPPQVVRFVAKNGIHQWNIGTIHTKPGTGSEPLDVETEIYSQPKLIH